MSIHWFSGQICCYVSFFKIIWASKNATDSFDHSAINLMVGCMLLTSYMYWFRHPSPCGHITKISSIYLHHAVRFMSVISRILFSTLLMKMLADDGAIRVPMAVPWICVTSTIRGTVDSTRLHTGTSLWVFLDQRLAIRQICRLIRPMSPYKSRCLPFKTLPKATLWKYRHHPPPPLSTHTPSV